MALSDIDKSPLYVDGANGRVGVGTASPSSLLHLSSGASSAQGIKIENSSGSTNGDAILQFTTPSVTTTIGIDATGTDIFKISNSSALGTSDALAIDSSGNVGIGTASPSNILHVSGTSGTPVLLERTNGSACTLAFKGNATTNNPYLGATSDDLYFNTGNAERMRIDSSGRVTMPYQPSFAATRNQGSVSNAVYVYPNVYHNTGSHYNSSNGRFTAPVSGSYFIATNHMSENNNTYNNSTYNIRVNGSTVQNVYSSNGGTVHVRWSWAGVIYLNQNDYVDIFVEGSFQLYGQSNLYSQFSGHLLG